MVLPNFTDYFLKVTKDKHQHQSNIFKKKPKLSACIDFIYFKVDVICYLNVFMFINHNQFMASCLFL